ncbi:MAG TPA: SpoIID/LytB domain-containing protein [Pyrinomonadaceae bacterium]|nr:SpoIID/LytB domain-containing protein [Pyrinomonadaceae bacterium]
MRSSAERFFIATFVACTLLLSHLALRAQDAGQSVTRPRRATGETWPTTPPDQFPNPDVETTTARITSEPMIRVGLAVNARSVTVSTNGHLLNATDPGQPVPLEVARVRIEPRTLPPLTAPTPDAADGAGVETASSSNDVYENDTSDGAARNSPTPRSSAPTTASTHAATASPVITRASSKLPASSSTQTNNRGGVRLTSRTVAPTRGEVLYAAGSTRPLLDERAPVVFASDDEERSPVNFNEKPYRGRIEVFANTRGTLTVVNVLPLEDYVRGVVPNELSPGGWPQLEALKAQAVAARTYAVSNLGRFSADGFDLTPDTRSQVYGGRSTEHPLTDRAVLETRGRVATYKGVPINALYTSTCGGRTEDAENIFGGSPVPYLRGRECAIEEGEHFQPFNVRTTRELPSIKSAEHATSARDAALLSTHGFVIPSRLGDEWLASNVAGEELRDLLGRVALLTRQPAPLVNSDSLRPGGFATALATALDGESRGAVLLNSADVEYLLSFRDADEVAQQNRADVAAMLREGDLSLFPDGTLRPRQPISRARVLHSIAHALESRGLLRLQKATARPSAGGALTLRASSGRSSDLNVKVSSDAFLFTAFGEGLFPVREINFVGGEAVTYHTGAGGEVDYIEARPSASGAASDHQSPFTNWAETLTPAEVLSRLSRSAPNVGTLLDLRVRRRGVSGRVLDLEVVGTNATAHVRGGRIRSALGLREQLFVIDRTLDESGRVTRFTFTGRGWGHGVGLCQVGAYGMARAGYSYDRILKAYYTGINVTKLY